MPRGRASVTAKFFFKALFEQRGQKAAAYVLEWTRVHLGNDYCGFWFGGIKLEQVNFDVCYLAPFLQDIFQEVAFTSATQSTMKALNSGIEAIEENFALNRSRDRKNSSTAIKRLLEKQL